MKLKVLTAAVCALAFALAAAGAPPADAAPKKKKRVTQMQPVPVSMAPRSRITVRARSFLDGGTEVLSGQIISRTSQQIYAVTQGKSPLAIIENTAFYHRDPLPGPFDLPDRRNPYPWSLCGYC
jgi:hypothetical protein